jgi:hypothetical protein
MTRTEKFACALIKLRHRAERLGLDSTMGQLRRAIVALNQEAPYDEVRSSVVLELSQREHAKTVKFNHRKLNKRK